MLSAQRWEKIMSSPVIARWGWVLALMPAVILQAGVIRRLGFQAPFTSDGADYMRIALRVYRFRSLHGAVDWLPMLRGIYLARAEHATLLYPYSLLAGLWFTGGNLVATQYIVYGIVLALISFHLFLALSRFMPARRAILPAAALVSMPWVIAQMAFNEGRLFFVALMLGAFAQIWHLEFMAQRKRVVLAGAWMALAICARPPEAAVVLACWMVELFFRDRAFLRSQNLKIFLGIIFLIPALWFGPTFRETLYWVYTTLWGPWSLVSAATTAPAERTLGHFIPQIFHTYTGASFLAVGLGLAFGRWKSLLSLGRPVLWALPAAAIQIEVFRRYLPLLLFEHVFAVTILFCFSVILLAPRPRFLWNLCCLLIGLNAWVVGDGNYVFIRPSTDMCRGIFPRLLGLIAPGAPASIDFVEVESSYGFSSLPVNCENEALLLGRSWSFHYPLRPSDIFTYPIGLDPGAQRYVLVGPFFGGSRERFFAGGGLFPLRQKLAETAAQLGDAAFPEATVIDIGSAGHSVKFYFFPGDPAAAPNFRKMVSGAGL